MFSSEQASDQARFAAREFVARWSRETGEATELGVVGRMLFSYEMGYMRGYGKGMCGAGGALEADLAAREFIDRGERATNEKMLEVVAGRMLFAYEMGYLRGHGDGATFLCPPGGLT